MVEQVASAEHYIDFGGMTGGWGSFLEAKQFYEDMFGSDIDESALNLIYLACSKLRFLVRVLNHRPSNILTVQKIANIVEAQIPAEMLSLNMKTLVKALSTSYDREKVRDRTEKLRGLLDTTAVLTNINIHRMMKRKHPNMPKCIKKWLRHYTFVTLRVHGRLGLVDIGSIVGCRTTNGNCVACSGVLERRRPVCYGIGHSSSQPLRSTANTWIWFTTLSYLAT